MLESYQDVLSIEELCEILRIGRKTAYQLLKSGVIPFRRVGSHYKISKDAVIEFLKGS